MVADRHLVGEAAEVRLQLAEAAGELRAALHQRARVGRARHRLRGRGRRGCRRGGLSGLRGRGCGLTRLRLPLPGPWPGLEVRLQALQRARAHLFDSVGGASLSPPAPGIAVSLRARVRSGLIGGARIGRAARHLDDGSRRKAVAQPLERHLGRLAVGVDARVDHVIARRQARVEVGVEDRRVGRAARDRHLLRRVDRLRRRVALRHRAELDREAVGARRPLARDRAAGAARGVGRLAVASTGRRGGAGRFAHLNDRGGRIVGAATTDQDADQEHPAEQSDPDHRGERREVGLPGRGRGRLRQRSRLLRRGRRDPRLADARATAEAVALVGGQRRPATRAGRRLAGSGSRGRLAGRVHRFLFNKLAAAMFRRSPESRLTDAVTVVKDSGERALLPPFTDEHVQLRETIRRRCGCAGWTRTYCGCPR